MLLRSGGETLSEVKILKSNRDGIRAHVGAGRIHHQIKMIDYTKLID